MTRTMPTTPSVTTTPSVRLEGWGWRHPGREAWAVRGVTLDIKPGERVLIVGNSGAGKTTLLHGIAGVLSEQEGEGEGSLTIAGLPASAPRVRGHVGLVQQDPETQRVMGRIGDEVAFGLENIGLPREEIWSRTREALGVVGLEYPIDHPTSHLSGGEKQRLALACALAMQPRIMLLDEPTANLDVEGAREVRTATEHLAQATGATLIIIEHNLGPWIDQADRLIVLTGGGVVADGPPLEVIANHLDLLREAGVWVPGLNPLDYLPTLGETSEKLQLKGEVALTTSSLAVGYADGGEVLTGLDLEFPEQVSTCVVGANGAGKTTLALTLAGLLTPKQGLVEAGSSVVAAGSSRVDPAERSPHDWSTPQLLGRISMVFQEPQYQFLTATVEEELGLGPKLSGLSEGEVAERVERYLDLLHLTHLRRAHPLSLSGGERRRLGVGTALIAAPAVIVLDEPTFGQDFNTWVDLVALLREADARGTTLITVTHDPYLVEALGERVLQIDALAPVVAEAEVEPRRPARSILSRVNPAAQLLGLFLMTIPLMLSIDPVSAGLAFALELLLLPLARLRPRQLLIRMSPLLVAAPLAAVSMLLYGGSGGQVYAAWGPVVISENSVWLALSISLRVLAVGLPAVVILPSLGSTEVADSLTQVAKLPSRFVLSSLAAIRMVGLMLTDWQALRRARRSRGLDGAHFIKAAFSLTTFALRRADSLSVSMEARGFGSDTPRSYARESRLSWSDAVMVLVCVSVPAISLGVALVFGSFSLFGIS